MCFRPAGVDMPAPECPHCGHKLQAVNGMFPKKCPFCKGDLTEFGTTQAPAPGAPPAPPAPGAPAAPKPPAAPGA